MRRRTNRRSAAMWNLSGNDVEQAKEQLKGRRAAIKPLYDDEVKRVDDELATIERFEQDAVEFMSQYKGEETPSETELAAEEPLIAADAAAEDAGPIGSHSPVEEPAEARGKAAVEAAAEPTNSSRWRLRLNAGSATEAA